MWHRQGKVSLTKGSDVVTGVNTNWVENIRVGDAFQGPDGKLYQVINVASNEALAISPAYEGSTAENLNYWIVPIPGYNKTQADRLSLIISKLDGDIITANDAAEAAQTAALQAQQWRNDAELSAAAALQSEQNAALAADIAEQARDDAVVVVTDGQGSLTPAPGKFPVAGTSGTIKQDWIENLQFELDALRVVRNKLMYGDGPYPVLDLRFQGAKYLDPRVTFTRSTPDWDWEGNEYGVNEPVLSESGMRIWASRTNLYPHCINMPLSGTHTVGGGNRSKIEGWGIFEAGLILNNKGGEVSSYHYAAVQELKEGVVYTFSTFISVEGGGMPSLGRLSNDPTLDGSLVLAGASVLQSQMTLEFFSGDVWRVSGSAVFDGTSRNYGLIQRNTHSGRSLKVWGYQLVEGEQDTPTMPTKGSQATVPHNTVFYPIDFDFSNFTVIGSMMVGNLNVDGSPYVLGFSNGVNVAVYIGIRIYPQTGHVRLLSTAGQSISSINTYAVGDILDFGLSKQGRQLKLCLNGSEIIDLTLREDLSKERLPRMYIGSLTNSGIYILPGEYRNITLYNRALSDLELKEITS